MHNTNIDFDNLVNIFEINYYNELLKYTNDNELITEINNIINKYSENNTLKERNKVYDNNDNNTVEESDMSIYYKKSWSKLNKIHKILKIKEFVENSILNKNKKNELIVLLIELVKNKTLTKKELVDYDEDKCKINSISNLEIVSTNHYTYV